MLGKLLKYDLKNVYKVLVVFYSLVFIFSVLTRIFFSIDNSMLFSILAGIASGVTISMLVSSLINGVMRSWARFVISMYKDESYLTHTLPVEKNTLYLSKVVTAVICSLTTVLFAVVCIFIAYYSTENMEKIKSALEIASNMYNVSTAELILLLSGVLFMEILFVILVGYVGIVIGHKSNKNKIAKSVLLGIIIYMGAQTVTLIITVIAGLLNPDIMSIIKSNDMPSVELFKYIMIGAAAVYTIYNVMLYAAGKRLLKKGVNVE